MLLLGRKVQTKKQTTSEQKISAHIEIYILEMQFEVKIYRFFKIIVKKQPFLRLKNLYSDEKYKNLSKDTDFFCTFALKKDEILCMYSPLAFFAFCRLCS
jgi:hypothetical protein